VHPARFSGPHACTVGTLVGRSVVVSANLGEVLRPGRPASISPTRVHTIQQEAFQMASERCLPP
jgi:hypothetical protein